MYFLKASLDEDGMRKVLSKAGITDIDQLKDILKCFDSRQGALHLLLNGMLNSNTPRNILGWDLPDISGGFPANIWSYVSFQNEIYHGSEMLSIPQATSRAVFRSPFDGNYLFNTFLVFELYQEIMPEEVTLGIFRNDALFKVIDVKPLDEYVMHPGYIDVKRNIIRLRGTKQIFLEEGETADLRIYCDFAGMNTFIKADGYLDIMYLGCHENNQINNTVNIWKV